MVEALVTVAILAILLGLAAPSMREVQVRWQVLRAAHALDSSFGLARSEAIRRAGKVAVRKSAQSCASSLSETQWDCGWVVFADQNGDGEQASTEPTLQVVDLPGMVQVQPSFSATALQLDRYGGLQGGNQHFALLPSEAESTGAGATKRVLCLSQGGRVRLLEGSTCS